METITTILRYLLLYIIIMSGSIFISYKTNKKIEKCIAPQMAIIILVVYLFGICDGLKYGVWFISILSIVLGIYAIVKSIKKDKKAFKERILTSGFYFFTLAFFILMITTYNKNLQDYDHYLYRSLNTKIMYYTDCMSRGFQALYPPSINILEYFVMKVIGTYIQGAEAFAVQMFGFALLIPIFDIIKKKSKILTWTITISIIAMPAILGNLIFYEAAYPDGLLGLLIGYSIYMLYSEESNKFKVFSVALALGITTITKPAGLYISTIVIGMYALVYLISNKCKTVESLKKFFKSKEFKNIIIITLTVLLLFASWKVFTSINNKYNNSTIRADQGRTEGNSLGYTLKSIAMTTFGYYEENHDSADSNNTMISKIYALYATSSPIRLTIYGAISAIIIASIVIYKHVVKDENKKKYATYIIALTIGLGVYIIFLQLSYILKFSTEEMLDHAGLNRYMPTFLLGMIYFIVAVAIKNMSEKNDKKINYIILIAIMISFTPLQSISNVTITSGIYNINATEYCNNGRIPANTIQEKVEKGSKIISIAQDEKKVLYNLMMRYYLYPENETAAYSQIKQEDTRLIDDMKKKILEENYEYMYIFDTDSTLNNILNKEFTIDDTTIQDETLYKVIVENEEISLQKVDLNNK